MSFLARQAAVLLALACVAAGRAGEPAVVIPLDKQYVPVKRDNKVVSYKTAYFGRVFVGLPQPQNFTVVFDTGSGHFFLPSSACSTDTCRAHKQYDLSASASGVPIDHTGKRVSVDAAERDEVAISFGTGEVTGDFIEETVCLTEHAGSSSSSGGGGNDLPQDCTKVRVILGKQMTDEPFSSFAFDGVMGLGLASLAVDPQFSVFEQLARRRSGFLPQFGYFLSDRDEIPSEVCFGGHDDRRVDSELQWAPVHRPELGFWQVKVLSISVGGKPLPLCEDGTCVAIADTGTSLLGAPRQSAQQLHRALARKVPSGQADLDCRDFPGPEMVFNLEGGVTVVLGAREYSRAAPMEVVTKSQTSQVVCRASLLPVDPTPALGTKAFILGEPMLRKYYTAYDWQERQVGFALAKQPAAVEGDVRHRVIDAPGSNPKPSMVHV
eukprot:gb/GFBE01039307.1/.p1 GENE.gb/GFBE01039307.1/~~gb/GFBE01039307.1/.p1  ORF type:complete len:437 (+),score=96.33 gb/GFBE01039307.1/:1-1311(+)